MKKRRYDIDWIRVIVFDILIFWHVGLFFVQWEGAAEWDLALKNNLQVSWLSWPMFFIRQWRLPILFIISGIGTRFALSSRTGMQYIRERVVRLLLPLCAGTLLLVPPVIYLERLLSGSYTGTFWSFYPHFFEGVYPEGNFSYHHLWFLAYLFLMSLFALPLFLRLRRSGAGLFNFIGRSLSQHPALLYTFSLPLILVQVTLENRYPLTMNLTDDWFAFSYYLICFIVGFILASVGDRSWRAMTDLRRMALSLGMLLSLYVLIAIHRGENPVWIRIIKPLNAWSWIIAIFGYASKYLNRDSAVLRYRNAAVYPFYILHFSLMLLIGYVLMNSKIHYAWKMLLMIAGTYGMAFFLYEFIISRINFIRPFFGLKRRS